MLAELLSNCSRFKKLGLEVALASNDRINYPTPRNEWTRLSERTSDAGSPPEREDEAIILRNSSPSRRGLLQALRNMNLPPDQLPDRSCRGFCDRYALDRKEATALSISISSRGGLGVEDLLNVLCKISIGPVWLLGFDIVKIVRFSSTSLRKSAADVCSMSLWDRSPATFSDVRGLFAASGLVVLWPADGETIDALQTWRPVIKGPHALLP